MAETATTLQSPPLHGDCACACDRLVNGTSDNVFNVCRSSLIIIVHYEQLKCSRSRREDEKRVYDVMIIIITYIVSSQEY